MHEDEEVAKQTSERLRSVLLSSTASLVPAVLAVIANVATRGTATDIFAVLLVGAGFILIATVTIAYRSSHRRPESPQAWAFADEAWDAALSRRESEDRK